MNLGLRTFSLMVSVIVIRGNIPIDPKEKPLPPCSEVDECEQWLSGPERKVCGMDGRTYKTRCDFLREHCKGGGVDFAGYGECSASKKCWGSRQDALKDAATKPGVFIPSCMPDGTFKPVQCHKDTGYCWCATPLGGVIINTANKSKIPDCKNMKDYAVPRDISTQGSTPRDKGILPGSGRLALTSVIASALPISRESILTTLEEVEDPSPGNTGRGGKKKPKRPRGCHASKRKSFNKNMLTNMIQEYQRENTNLVDTFTESSLQLVALQWKFEQLDTRRKDGRLRRAEYKSIQKIIRRNFKPRKCAKKFPKFCDLNGDKKISLDEWIKCFTSEGSRPEKRPRGKNKGKKTSSKTPNKKLRPCDNDPARTDALKSGNPNLFVPKCDRFGKFTAVQCYGSNNTDSWYCFCVDVYTGDMIPHTSVKNGTPNCPVSWPKCPPPVKEEKFLKALRSHFVKVAKEKIHKKDLKRVVINEDNVIEHIFKFLDKNNNKFIDRREKKNLRRMITKKSNVWICGRKIHIVCDSDSDLKISLKEFYKCLTLRKERSTQNESSKKCCNPIIDLLKSEEQQGHA